MGEIEWKALREPFLNMDRVDHVLGVILSRIRDNPGVDWRDTDQSADLLSRLHDELNDNHEDGLALLLLDEMIDDIMLEARLTSEVFAQEAQERVAMEAVAPSVSQLLERLRKKPPPGDE